ncbi:MAG: MATE family efflux transporter, partial [Selenomonadaceae bacterium]|nr:MATE family efflux transporter [Selenomonadaceae bacterium]
MANTKSMNMLQGSLWDKIVLFSVPLALTGVLQQLFNAADIMVLGQFVGKNAIAAVGNNISLIGILVNLFIGFSLGANVVIAQAIGARHQRNAKIAVHTSIVFAFLVGLAITVIG